MRYPKNQFKISLPSLQAAERAEKQIAQNKVQLSKQLRSSLSKNIKSRLNSGKRR